MESNNNKGVERVECPYCHFPVKENEVEDCYKKPSAPLERVEDAAEAAKIEFPDADPLTGTPDETFRYYWNENQAKYRAGFIKGAKWLEEYRQAKPLTELGKHEIDTVSHNCFIHLKELNPKGGLEAFVKLACAYGYRKAFEKFATPSEPLTCKHQLDFVSGEPTDPDAIWVCKLCKKEFTWETATPSEPLTAGVQELPFEWSPVESERKWQQEQNPGQRWARWILIEGREG